MTGPVLGEHVSKLAELFRRLDHDGKLNQRYAVLTGKTS